MSPFLLLSFRFRLTDEAPVWPTAAVTALELAVCGCRFLVVEVEGIGDGEGGGSVFGIGGSGRASGML